MSIYRILKGIEHLSQSEWAEIRESRTNMAETVEQVRKVVSAKYGDLILPPDAGALFERCLWSRKLDIISSAELVHSFYKFLFNFCTIHAGFSYLLPSTHQETWFESLGLVLLKEKDSKGRAMILFNIDRIPIHSFSMSRFVGAAILMVTQLTRTSVDIQKRGVVYIIDLNGFQLSHARQFSLSILKIIASTMQGSVPVKYKALHFVRNPKLFWCIYALIRPLLSEKMKSRIYVHGNDFKIFHRHVYPDVLPKYLGGFIPDASFADLDFTRKLCTMDEYYYSQFLQHGYMNTPNDLSKKRNIL